MIEKDYSYLLDRPEHTFDEKAIDAALLAKNILVTGAGGSIGSALVRRIVKATPNKVFLVGHGEDSIFQLTQQLWDEECPASIVPIVSDTYSPEVSRVLERENVDYVFHAAAHKHVELMEQNPLSAFNNNTQQTIWLARKCKNTGANLVFVSSDKAVNPTTVMGASKRLAEAWILANFPEDSTVLRFGNVLGSSGSLVNIIEQRLSRQQKINVTNPAMKRFFITVHEAVGLVLTAGLLYKPGLYVLEMGSQIPIMQIVRRLVVDPALVYIKNEQHPAEKVVEELWKNEDGISDTEHPAILRISNKVYGPMVRAALEILEDNANADKFTAQLFVEMGRRV